MKKIIFIIKRVVMALFILYTINLIISYTGIILPINIFSIITVSILGLPSVFGFLIIYNFII